MKNALDTVLAYHQRTKHHLQRYAAGPGEFRRVDKRSASIRLFVEKEKA